VELFNTNILPRWFVQLNVGATGKTLEVSFVLPQAFYNKQRIQTAEADEDGIFYSNTHKATAF
jgi:hypothetical protein